MAPPPSPIDIGQAATALVPLAGRLLAPHAGDRGARTERWCASRSAYKSPITGRAHRKRRKVKRATLLVPRGLVPSWPRALLAPPHHLEPS